MISKKYFSIAEVAQICLLPMHKLRYIEKSDRNIKITKIRGRRYYTDQDIQYIQDSYSSTAPIKVNHAIIPQIDKLIKNFSKLAKTLEARL
jgi:hypothetical protein